jgi:hypothetical protein
MLVGLAAAAVVAAPAIGPAALNAPAPASLTLRAEGRGVQIYSCAAKVGKPGAYGWSFKAPLASLYNAAGKVVARHYAGPTWEGVDGGKVVGELLAKAPSPDPTAIDWLLLSTKSSNGVGVIGKATYIRRISTVGGKAPGRACTNANLGAEAKVSYRADYYFYSNP